MANKKLEDLKRRKKGIAISGGEKKINAQHEAGKLTARERLDLLFDEGSFIELNAFVGYSSIGSDQKDRFPREGVITGYGTVDGRLVYAYAQDYTVLEGALGEYHAEKIVKVQELAVKTGVPIVGLFDSGGAKIKEGVNALSGYAKIFRNNTRSSGVIPQIAVILGPCEGGAAFGPAIADYVFMSAGTSRLFLTGSQVIKASTGLEISEEQLGGVAVHASKSGIVQFAGQNDEDTLRQVKELLSYLPSNNLEYTPMVASDDDLNRKIPALDDLVSEDGEAYDVFDVIRAIADDGQYLEVSAEYAKNIVTAYIRLGGNTVGVVANQPRAAAGNLDSDTSDKAARFIRRNDAFNIPILTIVDTQGFVAEVGQESSLLNHGAKLLYAYSEATVAKVTLVIGKAYGSAYIAMGSKELGADFVFAWPTAKISVLSSEAAVAALYTEDLKAARDPIEKRQDLIDTYDEKYNNPYRAAEKGYVDDVIIPAESRQRLISSFDLLESKRESLPAKKHGNIPL